MARLKLAAMAACALVIAAAAGPANAAVTQVTSPDAAYLAGTTLLGIAEDDFTLLSGLSDADLSVGFEESEVRTAGVTWLTWGSPPDTEGEAPRLLFTQTLSQITFDFSKPLSLFGFEAEPDFLTSTFTVDYYLGGVLQGSVSRSIDAFGGARLLAASGTFDRAVVTSSDDVFAFGQVRYTLGSVVPEPGTWALMILGFGASGLMLRRARGRVVPA